MTISPTDQDYEKELLQRAANAIKNIYSDSIYFAHPVNYYEGSKNNMHGTKESELVAIINEKLPFITYNPNQPHNQENYQFWKKATGNGMTYFFDIILPQMAAGIVLPFSDGMIGAGAYDEMEHLAESKKPVYEINESGIITIFKPNQERKLSIEKTRERVYKQ
ncbi:MAG: hypothetical protein KC535_03025 [Nanoarchaeota archaeon]|nr:hypothetical protein [Nanoarchaeota archaeon]